MASSLLRQDLKDKLIKQMNFIRSQTVNLTKFQRHKQDDDEIEEDDDLDEAYEEEEDDVIDESDEENQNSRLSVNSSNESLEKAKIAEE